jgi:hypothetical protein
VPPGREALSERVISDFTEPASHAAVYMVPEGRRFS